MTKGEWVDQFDRLKRRFGEKNFDPEFAKLAASETSTLPLYFFRKRIDTWIGDRKTSNPPLLVDFRECRLAFEKYGVAQEAKEASQTFTYALKDVLRNHYKVDTLKEAFELEKLKLRLGEKNAREGNRGPVPGLVETKPDLRVQGEVDCDVRSEEEDF